MYKFGLNKCGCENIILVEQSGNKNTFAEEVPSESSEFMNRECTQNDGLTQNRAGWRGLEDSEKAAWKTHAANRKAKQFLSKQGMG